MAPDGNRALSVSGDVATLWSLPKGEVIRKLEPMPGKSIVGDIGKFGIGTGMIETLAVDWKRELLVTGNGESIVRVWDLSNGKLLRTIATISRAQNVRFSVTGLALSPDGKRIFSSTFDPKDIASIRVWDRESGEQLKPIAKGPVKGRCYRKILALADGHRALVLLDADVAMWDVAKDEPIWKLKNVGAELVDATADGKRIVFVSTSSRKLAIWGSKGEVLRTSAEDYPVPRPCVLTLIGTDGTRALSGGENGDLVLWDLDEAKPSKHCKASAHKDPVLSVAASADGRWAITGSRNDVVQLWNLETGGVLRVLTAGPKPRVFDEEEKVFQK
jgi:WD40 repeat protein